MSLNLNTCTLGGRLTAVPELQQTPTGLTVLKFNLAVDREMSKEKLTDFIPCVAWNKTAEFINKYFTKGSAICVEGHIQTRNWDDKDGKKRYATEVIADRVHFVESKAQSTPAPQNLQPDIVYNGNAVTLTDSDFGELVIDDDTPF